jgi:peptidoglycan/LPS O-acetylase OafA/YrhL
MTSVAAYVPALDGLRALAVIAVMVYHSGLIVGGYLGVDVFFTLSGFLITSLLVDEYNARGTIGLRNFYYRRALRLLPALFTFLAVWTIVLLSTVPMPFWPVIWRYVAIVTFYVANWAYMLGSQLGIFGHTWSLAIEEQFYFVWPLIILFLLRSLRSRSKIMLLLLCSAGVSLVWRFYLALGTKTLDRVYWATDTHADGLLIGAALALLVGMKTFSGVVLHCASVGAAIVLVGLLMFTPLGPAFVYGVTSIIALSTAILIVDVLSDRSWLALVLEQPWMTWTGRISYGLYLWHFPVFFQLGILKLGPGQGISYERVVLAWVVTFAASAASYLLIERPALALKTRFAWQSRAAAITCPSSPESHR